MGEFNEDAIICDCSGTTCGKIKSLVDDGVVDSDTISRKTGAISGCGSCEWDIEELLDKLVAENVSNNNSLF